MRSRVRRRELEPVRVDQPRVVVRVQPVLLPHTHRVPGLEVSRHYGPARAVRAVHGRRRRRWRGRKRRGRRRRWRFAGAAAAGPEPVARFRPGRRDAVFQRGVLQRSRQFREFRTPGRFRRDAVAGVAVPRSRLRGAGPRSAGGRVRVSRHRVRRAGGMFGVDRCRRRCRPPVHVRAAALVATTTAAAAVGLGLGAAVTRPVRNSFFAFGRGPSSVDGKRQLVRGRHEVRYSSIFTSGKLIEHEKTYVNGDMKREYHDLVLSLHGFTLWSWNYCKRKKKKKEKSTFVNRL